MTTRLERVAAVLQKFPPAFSVAVSGRQLAGIACRQSQVRRYLASARDFAGLQIGSGPHHLDGWLASDILPWDLRTVYADATKPLPFDDDTFDYIVAEHIIEHLEYKDAMLMLRECHRILKEKGVLRLSTPDILLTHRLMNRPLTDTLERYVWWSNRTFDGAVDPQSAVHAVNRLQHEWGHKFLYDEETLSNALTQSGFADVTRQAPGESAHPALTSVDRHASEIGVEFNALESLIVEATK